MTGEKDYETVGRLIYGLQRAGLGLDELKAMAAGTAHPERAARAADIAWRFERVIRRAAEKVDREEIAQLLEEGLQLAHSAGVGMGKGRA